MQYLQTFHITLHIENMNVHETLFVASHSKFNLSNQVLTSLREIITILIKGNM